MKIYSISNGHLPPSRRQRRVESSTPFPPFETTVLPTTTISPVAPRKTIFKRTRRLLPLRAKVLATSMASYNATPPYAQRT